MLRTILAATLLSLSLLSAQAQDKLVIDDRAEILNEALERVLTEKLAEQKISYTSMVDFRSPCQYFYAQLDREDNDLIMKVRDCDENILGTRNMGSSILDASGEEQGLLLSYAIRDFIAEPGKYVPAESESVSSAAVSNIQPGTAIPDSLLSNEHDSRYFFAPSAYNLKQGELYYNTVYFLLHDIQYGISDNFSLGIGTTVIGLPLYLTPKFSIPLGQKSTIAIGDVLMFGTYGIDGIGNLAYGVYTYGGRDGNISLGAGHLYTNDNEITSETSSLVTNFSAMGRLTPYIFFLTENYVMTANFNRYASYNYQPTPGNWQYLEENFVQRNTFWYGIMGVRVVSKNRDFIAWQFGLTYVVNFPGSIDPKYSSWYHDAREDSNLIAFPTVSFTVKFGNRF